MRWDRKYHIVPAPTYRKRTLYGGLRRKVGEIKVGEIKVGEIKVGEILRELCRQRNVEIGEAHAMPDHIHTCLSIPPKNSVAHTIGSIKGKSAIRNCREVLHAKRMTGLHFWAPGYCVSTVGLDEETIRKYIQ